MIDFANLTKAYQENRADIRDTFDPSAARTG
jgi:hypothetical protein